MYKALDTYDWYSAHYYNGFGTARITSNTINIIECGGNMYCNRQVQGHTMIIWSTKTYYWRATTYRW